jgi:hypothetical protein
LEIILKISFDTIAPLAFTINESCDLTECCPLWIVSDEIILDLEEWKHCIIADPFISSFIFDGYAG